MARRCSNRTHCGMSQGLYNPFFQNGAYWYGAGGGVSATLLDSEGALMGTTEDDVILTNMSLLNFTIERSSTPGAQIGNITDGVNNEPIYAGDIITFTNLKIWQ